MPKITDMQIQKKNKTRANVYVDGEFAFALEMLTVMKLGLKIGQEVSEGKLKEAIFDSEKSVAFERSMDYLGRGMKTAKQMRDYLNKKGYDASVVEYVVSKLKEYSYVDDDAYAKLYVERNSQTKGDRRLKQELIQKGIAVSRAEEYAVTDGEQALTNATRLAERYMKNKPTTIKTLQNLQRYLLSRGYGYDVVNTIVRSYKIEVDEE